MFDSQPTVPASLELDDRTIDLQHARVTGKVQAKLTTREVELLSYLIARAGEVVTRDELHREVWQLSPRVVSRAVDATATRLRAKIEPDPDQPRHLLTVWGVGYRFELPRAEPCVTSPAPITAGLDRFFGRENEGAELLSALQGGHRLVSVTGPAGAGKTRFTARLAESAARRLEAGWCWCSLAEARTEEQLVDAVARALDARIGNRGPDPITSVLAGRGPTLLVLDNLEQVAAPAAGAIARWLAGSPQTWVLATSRSRLGIPGEHVIELGPLPTDQALALLLDRCAQVGLAPGAPEQALVDLMDRVDCLPLGVELLAAQLELLSPAQLHERLSAAALWLSDDRRDRPVRHSSLKAAVAASWELLASEEQRALVQAATFRGPFDMAAAEAVIELDGAETGTVLRHLRARSLLCRARPDGELQLYQAVREHAAEHGTDAGAVRRHASWFARLAAECFDPAGPPATPECIDWLRASADDLRAALDHALVDDPSGAVALGSALSQLLSFHAPPARAVALLDRVLDAVTGQPAATRGQLVRLRGIARLIDARGDEALLDAAEALQLGVEADDASLQGRALVLRGAAMLVLKRYEEADGALEAAKEKLLSVGDRAYLGSALCNRASALSRLGRLDEARDLYEEALVCHRAAGNARGMAVTLGNTGLLLVEQDQLEAGRRCLLEALDRHRRADDRLQEGVTLGHLAFAEARLGRPALAAQQARRATDLLTNQEERFYRAQAHRALAAAELLRGRAAEAEHALYAAFDMNSADADFDRISLAIARCLGGDTEGAGHTLDTLQARIDRSAARARTRWLLDLAWAVLDAYQGRPPAPDRLHDLRTRTENGTTIRLDPYLGCLHMLLEHVAEGHQASPTPLRAVPS